MSLSPFGPDGNKKMWVVLGAVGFVAVMLLAWLLGAFGESTDALAASDDPDDRREAVARLAESDSAQATAKLARLASDSDPYTARYAVRAMGNHLTEENRRAITNILSDRNMSAAARSEAASTLGKFKNADPVLLTRTLSADDSQEVRAGAAKGLARLKMPSTIPQLSKALEDPSEKVRLWAITAIHRMIVRRFPYDPTKTAAEQTAEIKRIREYLVKAGVL